MSLRTDAASGMLPGNNPVSGDYHGPDAITNDIGKGMQPLDSWSIEPRHVMANGNYVVAVRSHHVRTSWHRIDMHGAHVFRFNAEGLIVEAWRVHTMTRRAVDALLSA